MSKESASTKKIRPLKGVITKAIQETADTWTLEIFVHENDKNYQAGQFISIDPNQFVELRDFIKYFEHQKGKKEPIRAYSLTSAPYEEKLAITIKPEHFNPGPDAYPPLLSPFLASDFLLGRAISFSGYSGAYVMPEALPQNIKKIVHLVAGSGVVPSFSIIKDQLQNGPKHLEHILINVHKTKEDIIFHRELQDLESQHKNFKSFYFLTRENSLKLPDNYFFGRPSFSHIRAIIGGSNECYLFACGPAISKWQRKMAQDPKELKPRFMEWVQDLVVELKLDPKHFRKEVYG